MIANTVLITDRYHPSAIHRLKLKMAYEVKEHHSYELKPKDLVGVCALLIRSRTKIHSDLLVAANQLKVIVTATSGFDHIDLNACIRAGIHVMNTPMANAMSAAELTLCQMLNLTKSSISLHNGIIKNQSWKHHYSFFGELNRKLLGIIGYGHVGQRVSQLAKAFGMDIQVYDPYIDDAIIRQHNVFRVGLIELLRTSDFTSLHVPLTSETKKMINYQTLEHFNPDGYLLNMSRGEVIDENALIEALQRQKIKGAALDVFMKEPLTKDSRFLKIPNVLLTPHVGGYTRESYIRASQDAVDKILEFFGAGKVTDYLPPNVEWSKFLINSP